MLSRSTAVKTIIATVVIALLVFLFIDNSVMKWDTESYNFIARMSFVPSSNLKPIRANYSNLLFDHCELRELDPWDATIRQYLNPNVNSMKNCKPTVNPISKLIDGQLFIYENSMYRTCSYRCLLPKSDYELIYGKWITIQNGTRPECDIIEVNCARINRKGKFKPFTDYQYLHAQIFRKDKPKEVKDPLDKPNVHIILFDSVSESQFIRSMPKTRQILREHYDAFSFRHLNKIGLNSRPNGFAFLTGKAISGIWRSPMSVGHATDYPNNSFCNKYLDNEQFIGFRFQDDEYVTMMNEDWSLGIFNWPACKGFSKTPVDHYMRPFHLRVDGKQWKSDSINNAVHSRSCHETYYHLIEYLKDFISKYPDKPKFSLTWMVYLAHNDGNALYHTDEYFYQFFKDYKEQFSNSFLFVMGDHGNRFGNFRKTSIGEAEDNNPFLFLSIPERLRDDAELMAQIRTNSKQLITHYDIYATLVDIVKPDNPRIPNPLIRGSSLLKPLRQPRTCDRLRIPFEYCSCEMKKTSLSRDPVAIEAAEIMVNEMNRILEEDLGTRGKCAELKLKKNKVSADRFEEKSKMKLYKVSYVTQPGDGEFWGYVTQDPADGNNLKILSERFPRMNKYEHQARCASTAKYAAYCYCKESAKRTFERRKA